MWNNAGRFCLGGDVPKITVPAVVHAYEFEDEDEDDKADEDDGTLSDNDMVFAPPDAITISRREKNWGSTEKTEPVPVHSTDRETPRRVDMVILVCFRHTHFF